ncbi:hypothetical protein I79_021205 [Cricetulus griseus]|uniref:Uncharacterized protein n=1 Tax=Cricetulus griseus TaxID=10029 RepID=G3IC18_CRIGR|nr:hypothetical protein I79_021205 [Cricetulus griseus]
MHWSNPKHDFKTWIQFQGIHDKWDISELNDHVKPECKHLTWESSCDQITT